MGKLKKNSRSSRVRRKQQQLGKNEKDEMDPSTKNNKVMPLIQKLSSSSPNDRSMAISAISTLCDDAKVRKQLLKEKLVNIVMEQCLTDNNDEIVVQSFGLLRNLVLEEGYDLAKFLVRSNILVSVESNIGKASKSFQYMSDKTHTVTSDSKRELFDYAENLIGLTTALLISDQDIFDEIISKIEFLVKFIIDVLTWSFNSEESLKISSNLLNSILDFIYQISNQSAEFVASISSSFPMDNLLSLKTGNNLSKIYVQALRFHFSEVQGIANVDEFVLSSLQAVMSIITTVDVAKSLATLEKPIENAEKFDVKEDNKQRFNSRNDLESIDVGLDLIATLIEFNGSAEPAQKDQDLISYYVSTVAPALVELLSFKDQSFLNKSVICLNNLSWLFFELESKPVAWFEILNHIWDSCILELVKLQEGDDFETMADYLKLLGVVSRSLGLSLQGKVSLEQVQKVISRSSTANESIDDVEFLKSYFISLIGFLTGLAMVQGQHEITASIGNHLLETIESSVDVLNQPSQGQQENVKFLRQHYIFEILAIECVSAIFEIFGDETFDYDGPVFVSQGYVTRLMQISEKFKPVYKEIDKNKDPTLKRKAQEVAGILNQFIAYKQNQ